MTKNLLLAEADTFSKNFEKLMDISFGEKNYERSATFIL